VGGGVRRCPAAPHAGHRATRSSIHDTRATPPDRSMPISGAIPDESPRGNLDRWYPPSVADTTRSRSTFPLLRRCADLEARAWFPAFVCVEIVTPPWCDCAPVCATARSTRSTPGVSPRSSSRHLMIAALCRCPRALPSVADEHVRHDSVPASGCSWVQCSGKVNCKSLYVNTGSIDDVQVSLPGDTAIRGSS